MSYRELENLLRELAGYHEGGQRFSKRIDKAIAFVKQRQAYAAKRKSHFKHCADEKRELLR